MISKQTIRLWTVAQDKKEFERFRNLFNGNLKSVIDEEKISTILRENTANALGTEERVFVLHDPCDIRKPHSQKLENIGKVRDLNGNIITGYSTFNTVCVSEDGQTLQLSDITTFSNGDSDYYVRQNEIDAVKKKTEGVNNEQNALTEEEKRIHELITNGTYRNQRQVTEHQLREISTSLKKENESLRVCHILDRQFDALPYFEFITNELEDEFVIRLKVSRNSEETVVNTEGKKSFVKLVDASLPYRTSTILDKVCLNKSVYQQVERVLEWGTLTLNDVTYQVVRVTLLTREKKPIFKKPMLLLTNCEVDSSEDAFGIYRAYLMRVKIEGVFKFVKNALGWEQFQVRDWESIKNLIALAFFIGGYFYEIEAELANHPVIEWLCQLGGGKGKISRHYFLEGLKCLLIHQQVENFRRSPPDSKDFWDDALSFIP